MKCIPHFGWRFWWGMSGGEVDMPTWEEWIPEDCVEENIYYMRQDCS